MQFSFKNPISKSTLLTELLFDNNSQLKQAKKAPIPCYATKDQNDSDTEYKTQPFNNQQLCNETCLKIKKIKQILMEHSEQVLRDMEAGRPGSKDLADLLRLSCRQEEAQTLKQAREAEKYFICGREINIKDFKVYLVIVTIITTMTLVFNYF